GNGADDSNPSDAGSTAKPGHGDQAGSGPTPVPIRTGHRSLPARPHRPRLRESWRDVFSSDCIGEPERILRIGNAQGASSPNPNQKATGQSGRRVSVAKRKSNPRVRSGRGYGSVIRCCPSRTRKPGSAAARLITVFPIGPV